MNESDVERIATRIKAKQDTDKSDVFGQIFVGLIMIVLLVLAAMNA